MFMWLQEMGTPFQGLSVGYCLTLRNELSEETHMLTKQETLLGRGTQVASRRVREPSAMWLSILGFIMMVMVSGLSLTNHSDSGSFMVAHTLLSQDGFQLEGFWEDIWTGVSFLLLTFLEF